MATIALHSAATGLSALSTQIDVIANNLANVNTTAFKGSRVNFETLLYEELRQPGVENANGDRTPAGTFVGLGVQVSNTEFAFSPGSAVETGNPLALYIKGNGFFAVDIVEDEGEGIGYTRSGNFFVNREGEMVFGNSDGPRLEPPIDLPTDATSVSIAADGTVSVTTPGSATQQVVGQIELVLFANPKGLKPIGGSIFVESDASGDPIPVNPGEDGAGTIEQGLKPIGANIFVETESSGPPIEGNPGEDGLGEVLQGFLESSNVNPVRELVDLIKTQRAFEMNSQSIQAADEALQVVSNLRRF